MGLLPIDNELNTEITAVTIRNQAMIVSESGRCCIFPPNLRARED